MDNQTPRLFNERKRNGKFGLFLIFAYGLSIFDRLFGVTKVIIGMWAVITPRHDRKLNDRQVGSLSPILRNNKCVRSRPCILGRVLLILESGICVFAPRGASVDMAFQAMSA
jgi:hypothetical protein